MFNLKFFTQLILLLILSSCEYSPVFKDVENKNIKILISEMNGDNFVNSFISSKLQIYSSSNSENTYHVNVNSNYEKKDLSKNSTGQITNYELKFQTEFKINTSTTNKIITVKENYTLYNSDDTYSNNKNENSTKKKFASTAVEKLISEILFIK